MKLIKKISQIINRWISMIPPDRSYLNDNNNFDGFEKDKK